MLFKRPTVLIVEDNEQLGTLYCKVLSQVGLQTYRAICVSDALLCLEDDVPDMVLLDMTMRDGNGTAIIDYINDHPQFKDTEIVVATGGSQYQAYAEEHGVEHFFQKPVSVRMLMDFTRRLLGNRLPTAQLVDMSTYV